jgi:hypothetical protein
MKTPDTDEVKARQIRTTIDHAVQENNGAGYVETYGIAELIEALINTKIAEAAERLSAYLDEDAKK